MSAILGAICGVYFTIVKKGIMQMSSYHYTGAILLSVLIAGCGSIVVIPPAHYDVINSVVVEKPLNKVWVDVIDSFASSGIPVDNVDQASGLITSKYELPISSSNNEYCDCGSGATQNLGKVVVERITGSINVVARQVNDAQTRITVNTFFRARMNIRGGITNDLYGTLGDVDCQSKGKLERIILRPFLSK
ncbi:MAG: hypothetical protein Q8O33_03695 [Pseudomonadota bacterium]|nr:hypothetical protein [Pseudomonadota bacterium]